MKSVCKRCRGTGYVSYEHVENGRCFACNCDGKQAKSSRAGLTDEEAELVRLYRRDRRMPVLLGHNHFFHYARQLAAQDKE